MSYVPSCRSDKRLRAPRRGNLGARRVRTGRHRTRTARACLLRSSSSDGRRNRGRASSRKLARRLGLELELARCLHRDAHGSSCSSSLGRETVRRSARDDLRRWIEPSSREWVRRFDDASSAIVEHVARSSEASGLLWAGVELSSELASARDQPRCHVERRSDRDRAPARTTVTVEPSGQDRAVVSEERGRRLYVPPGHQAPRRAVSGEQSGRLELCPAKVDLTGRPSELGASSSSSPCHATIRRCARRNHVSEPRSSKPQIERPPQPGPSLTRCHVPHWGGLSHVCRFGVKPARKRPEP